MHNVNLQRLVGWMIFGGLFFTIVFYFGGYLLVTPLLLLAGGFTEGGRRLSDTVTVVVTTLIGLSFLTMIAGLALGWRIHAYRFAGKREVFHQARVVARFALDTTGRTFSLPEEMEFADDLRFYVRLSLPNRTPEEFECAEETFWTAGEGMWGDVEIQGQWLGRFTPVIGPSPVGIR